MAVRGFITAFRNIDTDHDDVISHEDLWKYAREKDMPEAFVNVSGLSHLTEFGKQSEPLIFNMTN
ncbi:unnamed protein product [Rodentolepis nana]|uniref:EF-hand domain-containing protein n=1 Tax=Rodentolepis nana TaxID=102285 RepID=A0A0R3T7Y2_RODNA|nr:unnamed protein product [Rodentolepis nana]